MSASERRLKLKRTTVLLFVVLCAASILGAKLVEATFSAYRSVEAAQQEGVAFPHGTPQGPSPTFGSVGTVERKCVAVSAKRSGRPVDPVIIRSLTKEPTAPHKSQPAACTRRTS